ncbi:uncharacterized protein METZ01_LOCUS407767, partial [marine metagenome]
MQQDYYSRRWEKNRFANQSDREAEDLAQRSIEAAWGCRLHKYADFDSVDFWAEAFDRTSALIEVK